MVKMDMLLNKLVFHIAHPNLPDSTMPVRVAPCTGTWSGPASTAAASGHWHAGLPGQAKGLRLSGCPTGPDKVTGHRGTRAGARTGSHDSDSSVKIW